MYIENLHLNIVNSRVYIASVATLNVAPTLNVALDVKCRKADAKCRNQR